MCKHIPQQSEVDKFLKNIRTKVLHTTQLLIQTESLITGYSKSPDKYINILKTVTSGVHNLLRKDFNVKHKNMYF